MCGAHKQVAGRGLRRREHQLGLPQRGGDGLLDQHVLAGLERREREAAVLGHAGEHEHDVDVGVGADRAVVGQVGGEVEPIRRRAALGGVGVVDRDDVDAALAAEPLDQAHVRRPEDAPAADDAEADAHLAVS